MKYELRLLDTYASKIAKICDLKTFWPLIQLINHLKCHYTFYIYGPLCRKAFCQILKSCFISPGDARYTCNRYPIYSFALS